MRQRPAVSGRSPIFRAFTRALRQAQFLAKYPKLRSLRDELPDLGADVRRGDRMARREFMRTAAKLGIALPIAGSALGRGLAAAAPIAGSYSRSADPVAILGGGAAGLTAALRLNQGGIPCEIFEGSNRTGGRIFTLNNYFSDGQFCELGAELVDTNHADLIALAGELGVGIQELKEGDNGVELMHFDGKIYTEKDLIPKFEGLAIAIAEDQGQIYAKDANGEETDEWTDRARELDKVTVADYLAAKKDLCEKWIIDFLNVAYTIEYGRDTSEQTALNLLTYLDPDTSEGFKIFGDSDESKRVLGGNSVLMEAVAKALEGKVKISFNHMLMKIDDTGSAFNLTFSEGGKAKTASFSRVICTLPFTMLREVEGVGKLALDPVKQESIKTLGYGTNVKVMYGFSERAWRTPGTGRPECNGSMYTSLASQCFWETSRKQNGKSGILTNFLGGSQGLRTIDDARKKEALDHLDKIVPGLGGKSDGKWRSWVWPTYKFSKGAYSCPLLGQLTTVWDCAPNTELNGRLLFAGEHTSADFGGFMNGAIETGIRVAKEILAAKG